MFFYFRLNGYFTPKSSILGKTNQKYTTVKLKKEKNVAPNMSAPFYTVQITGGPSGLVHYLNLRTFSLYPQVKMCLHSISFMNVPANFHANMSVQCSLVTQLNEVLLPTERANEAYSCDNLQFQFVPQCVVTCQGIKDVEKSVSQIVLPPLFFNVNSLTTKTEWLFIPHKNIKPPGWDNLQLVLHYSFYGGD